MNMLLEELNKYIIPASSNIVFGWLYEHSLEYDTEFFEYVKERYI